MESKKRYIIKKIPIYLEKIFVQVLSSQYNSKISLLTFANQYKYRKYLQKTTSQIVIEVNKPLDINILTKMLSDKSTYTAVKRVWSPGEFSLLGDIMNIWLYGTQYILRISMFDKIIEKIQFVDPQTGLCKSQLQNYQIALTDTNNLIESLAISDSLQPITTQMDSDIFLDSLSTSNFFNLFFAYQERFIPLDVQATNYKLQASINPQFYSSSYNPSEFTFVNILSTDDDSSFYDIDFGVMPLLNDGGRVGDKEYIRFLLNAYQRLNYSIFLLSDYIKTEEQFNSYMNQESTRMYSDINTNQTLEVSLHDNKIDKNYADSHINIQVNRDQVIADNNYSIQSKDTTSKNSSKQNISNIQFVSATKLCKYLNLNSIPRGWVNTITNTVFITDYELYGSTILTDNDTKKIIDDKFSLITKGDYLVHEDHGIGIYAGIETKNNIDYYVLTYAQGDKLYVPLTQTNKLTKYIGSGRKKPILTRLSGGHWKGTKEKVYKDVEHIAKELLQLYAMRTLVKAPNMLSKDEQNLLVRLFVKSFEYEDTDDQRIATTELLEDLKKENPTDRLLVGDVGFGKTEIAIRGAYAAFVSGMQTAFMAPTTVLVEQHKGVLIARFENFRKYLINNGYTEENARKMIPKVESISRFATIAERRETVSRVVDGNVDILVGTHAILSNAVKFKKLGFVIIDEEQRFGVKHKEKLKSKRLESHVLSMTATPIPRTLNLALNNVRDLSVIATAPLNRKEIINITAQYSIEGVVQAIKKELDRGGQVFYLHNRIADIERIALNIMKYCPEAKVGVAHGRLSAKELAMTMRDFASMKLNVLVCTTIIENGIDLPNVNTMIIDDIERLGLSQMYQIRGRIGRGEKQAYSYFLHKTLGGESALRLEAIQDFHALGSGLLLANRDLEIRGAGTILGDNQSGAVDAVGFKLYSKMLEEAVSRLKKMTTPNEGIWIR